MYSIKQYNSNLKEDWDYVVSRSYNGIFQHKRDFIDYSSKEEDSSIILYKDNIPFAVFPAIYRNNTIISHPYLSVGGLVYKDISGSAVFYCIKQIKDYYSLPIEYKRIPHQFHKYPVEEDKWSLFQLEASLVGCELSSVVSPVCYDYNSENYQYCDLDLSPIDFSSEEEINHLWDSAVIPNLLKHNISPTHSSKDMLYLYSKFPAYITGIKAQHIKSKKVLGVLVIFKYNKCYHVQYSITTAKGRALNALNILHCFMLKNLPSNIVYYNFGKSTEKSGNYLNEPLFNFKKSFGAGSFVYETFRY